MTFFSSQFVTVLEKEYFLYSLFPSEQIGGVCLGLWGIKSITVLVLSYCDQIKLIIYD